MIYPKRKYSKLANCVVYDADQESCLGSNWYDSEEEMNNATVSEMAVHEGQEQSGAWESDKS